MEGAGGEEDTAAAAGELDPLVSNGLGSPNCERSLRGALPPSSLRNCETSGFVASAAPTGDYGIDVHIDTGALGLSRGGLLSIVQSLLLTPAWMALVWAIHALVVMLEWCFTVNLLGGAATGGFGGGLRVMERALTEPWLPLALSVAAVLALYHGLIRRRVAETVAQVALMVAMMAGGLWVILDPTGTVGALGQWADEAAIGTLATASQGSPAQPGRALGENLESIFAATVEAPWCYLEFGDVAWCRRPERLDVSLYHAGLRIAAEEQSGLGCKLASLVPCATPGSGMAKLLQRSAQMLRDARSNGAIFLALPANGPARNSINDAGSLLRLLCGSTNATSCSAATAAQAQFRTEGSTWSRVGGLLLIAAGLLGMLALLGFLALRLLAAAIFSLLYLLLAPAMVLAPAFGDGGRALFRKWISMLVGAITAKLVYSFLLGVVMAVLAAIASLSSVGWWTQWLLMSALWWGAFMHRHQALGVASGVQGPARGQSQAITRRLAGVLEGPRAIAARHRAKRRGKPAPVVKPRADAGAVGPSLITQAEERLRKMPRRTQTPRASATPTRSREVEDSVAAKRAQLDRIRRASDEAREGGQRRRSAELEIRGERVASEIENLRSASVRERDAAGVSPTQPTAEPALRAGLDLAKHDRGPDDAASASRGQQRDYAALAYLAGYGREEFQHLDSKSRGAARREIDRALALREQLSETRPRPSTRAGRHPANAGYEPTSKARREDDRSAKTAPPERPARKRSPQSIVMREAREVQAGRKRQLGRDRP